MLNFFWQVNYQSTILIDPPTSACPWGCALFCPFHSPHHATPQKRVHPPKDKKLQWDQQRQADKCEKTVEPRAQVETPLGQGQERMAGRAREKSYTLQELKVTPCLPWPPSSSLSHPLLCLFIYLCAVCLLLVAYSPRRARVLSDIFDQVPRFSTGQKESKYL